MSHQAELLNYLGLGGVVVGANARASRALERDFALDQQELGHRAWSDPRIAPWQIWLDQLWQQHVFNSTESRLLLSSVQERAVWRRIVGRDAAAQQVLSPDALATLAQEAYGLLGDYRAYPYGNRLWTSNASEDVDAFRSWAAAFDRQCHESNWVSRSHLAKELADQVRKGTVTVAKEIRTLGFDRFTPAQQHLLDTAEAAGCQVAAYQQPLVEGNTRLFAAKDRSTEINACAHWLRARLLAQPGQRLAVITSSQNTRAELDRVLRRVLMPASMHLALKGGTQYDTVSVTELETASAYEFSLGVSMESLPVVRAALLLLRWLTSPLRQEEVAWLLLSGFLTQTGDANKLAQLDARLRARALLLPEIELGAFLKQREHAIATEGSELFQQLGKFAAAAMRSGIPQRKRSPMEWAEEVHNLLSVSGWPGSQTQSSLRFQALDKWEHLLTLGASLNFDGTRLSYHEFLTVLEEHASEMLFAPQSREAPVQIIGAFESSGQTFDGIWFMGAEENAWPAQGNPHPLIPIGIQRAVGMPHANMEVDWELALAATRRIASSATECIFSYAKQNQDGDLRMSPLLATVLKAEADQTAPETFAGSPRNATMSVALEEVEESASIPWPRERIAGGAAVLTSQSACAFQAFARRRLRAQDLECSEWGLSPPVRGDLLHQILESLWCGEYGLRSLHGLEAAFTGQTLEPLLSQKVEEVFGSHPATRAAEGWTKAYIEAEKLRFSALLMQWLRYERHRRPFEVEACEKDIEDLRVGELKLKVRVDRIDGLPNGQKLLIDYKTGVVSASKWECPRPEEPQLPLYATYGDLGEISGLLFAQIRAGSTEFKGQTMAPRELLRNSKNGVDLLTEEARENWRRELLRLANDFLHGEAAVAPKDYPRTCAYCGMQGLCRVAETDVPLKASDVDAPDESGQADGE